MKLFRERRVHEIRLIAIRDVSQPFSAAMEYYRESLQMDSEGRIIEVVLGTEFSDYDRRTGDNKTRPKTGAGSSHGNSVQALIQFVILHSFLTLKVDSRPRVNETASY